MTKITLTLIILFNCITFAQNSKLQFAKTYLEAGKYEDAARMYKELYDADSKNMEYFSGLVQSYNYLNKHKELIPIVEKQLKNQYYYVLDVFLGELILKVEGKEKAISHWNKIIDNDKDEPKVYLTVSEAMTANKLFNEAIDVTDKGRKKFKDAAFSDRLIKLYITTNDYKLGTELIIDALNKDKDLVKAEGHIYAFMTSNESKNYLKEYLLNQSEKNSNDIYIQELIAWYFRTTDDLSSAFNVYVRLDKLKNTSGREILNFADLSRKDGYYKEAFKAYEVIIDTKEYERFKRNAIYGYALALEEQLKTKESVSREQAMSILKRYQDLIDLNKNSNEALDAMYRIAIIKKKWLNDFEGSNKDLKELMKIYAKNPIVAEAGLQLGLNYMEMGQLDEAKAVLNDVYNNDVRNNLPLESLVEYQLANTIYYSGNIDSAAILYERLSVNERDDISNDALEKLLLIDENKDLKVALSNYAKAEYSLFRKEIGKAKEEFLSIFNTYSKTKISDRSALEYAEILFEEKKYSENIKFLEDFRFNNVNSIFTDKVLILLADSYYLSGNSEKAVEKLKEILIDYSNSIYIQEVRDKIKKYRGQS